MCVLPRTARRVGRENARPVALPIPVVRHLAMEKANALREARLGAEAAERESQALLAARPELQFKVETIDEPVRLEAPIPIPLPAPAVRLLPLPPTTLSITGQLRRRRAISELDPLPDAATARTNEALSTRARSAESPTRQLLEMGLEVRDPASMPCKTNPELRLDLKLNLILARASSLKSPASCAVALSQLLPPKIQERGPADATWAFKPVRLTAPSISAPASVTTKGHSAPPAIV